MKNDGSEVNGRVARHVPGLTALLDITERDGRHTCFSTDATWRGSTKNRFSPSGIAPSSIPDRIDARRDSGDWTLAGFDESNWEKPVRVDGRQWGPLRSRSIPRLRETEVKPLTLVRRAGKAANQPLAGALPIEMKPNEQLVIDAGQFAQAYSVLDLEAEDGSELELEYAQTFFDTDRKPGGSNEHINRYIARAGRQTYMSGDTFGCKYVVVRLKSGQVRLHGVRLVNRLYPFDVVGRFQSDDKLLNRLWQIGVNTVRLLSEDAYVDSALAGASPVAGRRRGGRGPDYADCLGRPGGGRASAIRRSPLVAASCGKLARPRCPTAGSRRFLPPMVLTSTATSRTTPACGSRGFAAIATLRARSTWRANCGRPSWASSSGFSIAARRVDWSMPGNSLTLQIPWSTRCVKGPR